MNYLSLLLVLGALTLLASPLSLLGGGAVAAAYWWLFVVHAGVKVRVGGVEWGKEAKAVAMFVGGGWCSGRPARGERRHEECRAAACTHASAVYNDDEDDEDFVDASFAFFDPRPDDVPRLRSLLLDLARSLPVSDAATYAHTLAEAVAAQTRVGTTVRVDAGGGPGDEVLGDALGFITALPLATHAALLAPLLSAMDMAMAGGLPPWVVAPGTKLGVVLCERVVNLPPALVPWLHTALWDELGWAVEDEPTAALRDAYALSHFVILTDR
ncbi:hypothetical protein I4F81_001175 [Pyropia yezoensis]|uniref:Uncharacterized protein n=1 Tax=Pyropia yezoensis TaxID=2788 RepID=A0ACC3BKS5_PYRYE|nr:hypothetical protein I4F81_001175 [Neopyropia yezoensis]